ncbi:L-aminoadipate-semialdehyde dehydrogenase [Zancudomyces culisetae]|uniref:Alpha-aminoadipate reductase n=1 Tax=Zancudomyces culisetae TaxID=1213189 RepID=A0A1R1PZL4_ZANCU|nr:L-aminoadipate-semialdehyde dehydrogenase [Zancudomyces culisetae]|eukprot:OMH86385.1 L-aminoadipate-semialdehyde dehydrogenase [Zancudomyces culisetae]
MTVTDQNRASTLVENIISENEVSERLQRLTKMLEAHNELVLPTDYPRPVPLKVVEASEDFLLPDNISMSVIQLMLLHQQKMAQENGSRGEGPSREDTVTPFTVLLAAFAVLLHRYTASEDVVVGSSSESSNALVLRVQVSPTDTFMEVLDKVQKIEKESVNNQVPFDQLVNAIARQLENSGRAGRSEAQLTALNSLSRIRFYNAIDTTDMMLEQMISQSTDLTVFISQESTTSLRQMFPRIKVKVVYNQVLFTRIRILHILEHLKNVISAGMESAMIGATGDQKNHLVGSINLVTPLDKKVLPDPNEDLHWGEFPGSITGIFAKNATAHPTKRFISERLLGSDGRPKEQVEYSYEAIFNASRIVSRKLRLDGIERGDVVVIYAYRGVDLVVAIMGVLMSGATFSVIDPAYPPARQNIYLSVAQPRGLIILGKAGSISDEVSEYITKNLSITSRINGLGLESSTGKLVAEEGCLEQASSLVKASIDPMEDVVEVGPDSVGTLSFTSGSTGIPKGVQGRHYSLTHFYPWMREKYGLSENERFTMLSGIAHDPIQRDIFTPIFLGAELHIPTTEDIGIPGQLADWMAKSEITVTHLTPAMGQLLAANASAAIPSLRNAFFVGDLLTKRDCNRLQALAPNCAIVNMYGTTETQRAVSYSLIQPRAVNPTSLASAKEIIPAGSGMVDVQLLVVNLNNKQHLCGVGEIGEIYVRSGGLAEGYLRLEKDTAEKFVNNWFSNMTTNPSGMGTNEHKYYLGPRDRMYKTGDLGRYRPDGEVECIGRVDDQVKIRGFRIELGEINNILSQYSMLRASVVLVRRDKNEEQQLVGYIVIEEKEGEEGRANRQKVISDIREYLKLKLPSYSIPSVFVPMKKLPLTPNGKIDKAALPFPDTPMFRKGTANEPTHSASDADSAGEAGTTEGGAIGSFAKNLGDTELALAKIWASLLELPSNVTIDKYSSFFDLGGHSISATRMIFRVRNELVSEAPLGMVYQHPTLSAMASAIDDMINSYKLPVSENGIDANSRAQSSVNIAVADASTINYSEDYEQLIEELRNDYPKVDSSKDIQPLRSSGTVSVLLTGATGFLGAYILMELLNQNENAVVHCLVRAKDIESGFQRIRTAVQSASASGSAQLPNTQASGYQWNEDWVNKNRIQVILGDLAQPRLGMSQETWDEMDSTIDVILHNGAMVNWVWPYDKLRSPNVLSTMELLRISSNKRFVFISSTSVLDTNHYVQLGNKVNPTLVSGEGVGGSAITGANISTNSGGVPEQDDLEGSRLDLRSGYGQSKWVSEKLLFYARNHMGYQNISIVRPGYIIGDSRSGVTNTDDFIWRLVKGCIQLGKYPVMDNIVNMCPVDFVSRVSCGIALTDGSTQLVYHIYNHQQIRFRHIFDQISRLGFELTPTEYIAWRDELFTFTLNNNDSALFPLLHFVLDDLPTSTLAPQLNTTNTDSLCSQLGISCPVVQELFPLYAAYLVGIGFLELPTSSNTSSSASNTRNPLLGLLESNVYKFANVFSRNKASSSN